MAITAEIEDAKRLGDGKRIASLDGSAPSVHQSAGKSFMAESPSKALARVSFLA